MYFSRSFSFIFATSIVSLSLITTNSALRDGNLYRFTSLVDENVFTVSGRAGLSGTNITAEPWQDGSNQKWLAVEAVTSGSNRFLLLSKWQSWDWNKFTKDSTKNRKNSLPDSTVVTTVDPSTGIIFQGGYTGKSVQQWKLVDVSKGVVSIRNVETETCVSNPGEQTKREKGVQKAVHKVTKLFAKQAKKHQPGVLNIMNCDATDDKQMWRVEEIQQAY